VRPVPERRWPLLFLVLALAFCLLRFAWLRADFPNHSPWMIDQAKFTDEGWWASAAVRHFLIGHWQVPGDYNPAVAVPVWPLLLTLVFHFTGVSIVAARAVNVLFSMATVGLLYALVRKYSTDAAAAWAAVLLAASPFAFAFSRLAILDTVIVFQFCLLLLLASYAQAGKTWPLMALGLLIPITLFTKTTALVLLPAVAWLLWMATQRKFPRAVLTVAAVACASAGAYLALVLHSRYADDYRYFFDINALEEFDWRQVPSYSLQLLHHGLWIDRILYPVALAVLLLSLIRLRVLWSNPLFAAAWMAIAGEAVFILRRMDDYAPRYFLVMLVPVILVSILTLQELSQHHRTLAAGLTAVLCVAILLDGSQDVAFLHHRQFQFEDAARSIRSIVNADSKTHRLLLGSSGGQLSLMTGIPSINDGYSSEDLDKKAAMYQPGWYVGWNDLDQDIMADLAAFHLDKVATFRVFDHDERDLLTLYRMSPAPARPSPEP
jgi:4-amino-4-deoxy-L-arabinose transferase-like glycosyltransferase